MNHPKQLSPQRLLSLLVCISFFATVSTNLFGQRVIQRTYPAYQQPSQYTPFYPSRPVQAIQPQAPIQIQNGPIIYGQPIPIQNGRIINSQIINGQIVNGQIIQPGVIITPQIAPQPKSVLNKALNVNQDDEMKRLVSENKRLEALALDSGKQKREVQRLQRELYKARLDFSEMQKSTAIEPADTNSATMGLNGRIKQQQKEIGQLSANYQNAFQRNESLTREIKKLTDESSRLRALLNKPEDSQDASGMELLQLQSNLTTTSNALDEIKKKNAAMTTEYRRMQGENKELKDLYESTNMDKANLKQRVDEMSSKNDRFMTQLSEYEDAKDADVITEVEPVEYVQKPIVKSKIVADQDSPVFDLEAENRQLFALNEKSNQQNTLLNRRIAELEGTVNELSIDDGDRVVAKTSIASTFGDGLYNPSVQTDASTGKYNIMRWLIPFLGIGLFIGLYVFLTEEYQGTSRALVIDGDIRDDRERRLQS